MLKSDLLLKWFTVNPEPDYASHPKVHAIPIGLENRWYNSSGEIYRLEQHLRDEIPPPYSPNNGISDDERGILVYINFNYDTNPARKLFAKFFKSIATFQKKGDMDGYLNDLRRSKFVLSPPGK